MLKLSGIEVSKHIRQEIREEVDTLKLDGIEPCLAVILVGNNEASKIYVRNKEKACSEVGIKCKNIILDDNISLSKLLEIIYELNNDSSVHGILCQLPLPSHLNQEVIINAISSEKDVDVFREENLGKVFRGKYDISPCTPSGIIAMLDYYNIEISGRNCVVIGRSDIVGKPVAMLLSQRDGTVTICHSRTKNLVEYLSRADIVVSAVGKSKFLNKSMLKKDSVVIDVGINRDGNGKLCGDVDTEGLDDYLFALSPVPGGVGPLTITYLLYNTVQLAILQNNM